MIKLIAVGKLKEQYLVNMVEDYKKRINKYHKLEIVEINDDGIEKEGIKILEKLSKKSSSSVIGNSLDKFIALFSSVNVEVKHDNAVTALLSVCLKYNTKKA